MIPPLTRSLSGKLLVLTAFFVMLAEVLIFLPSIARFRVGWLEERLAAGHLAALTVQAAPDHMLMQPLEEQLLRHVGAHSIDLALPGERVLMLGGKALPPVAADYDLRTAGPATLIGDAVSTLVRQPDRTIRLTGTSPKDGTALVTLILDERPLAAAMLDFAGRILALSAVISLITAGLVFLSLRRMLVRPLQRIVGSMVAFRQRPDDPSLPLPPGTRHDEVGTAERELAVMQGAVRDALRQQARLAALGTAVTKINHDLRNILSTAALVSERLAVSDDPEVRRITPRLMETIDRAVHLCASTLDYTRDGTLPLDRRPTDLAELAAQVGAELAPPYDPDRRWEVAIPPCTQAMADRDQLHRVLFNLGHNAFLAGAKHVRVSVETAPGRLRIIVADDGPGLPPRARENLFKAFAGSARSGGTGLGLAIAREVALAHGGDLRLLESTGQGTVFALDLPHRGNHV